QLQRATAGGLVGKVGRGQRCVSYFYRAGVAEDTVFKGGVDVEVQPGVRVEIELGAQQRSEGVDRRTATGQLAEEDPGHRTRERRGQGRVVGEVACGVAVG